MQQLTDMVLLRSFLAAFFTFFSLTFLTSFKASLATF
jgi:hypothetical protein